MTRITLTLLEHREARQIGIRFVYNEQVKANVKNFFGVRWSQTHKVFYVKDTAKNRDDLFRYFRRFNYYVDYSAFRSVSPPQEGRSAKKETKPGSSALYKRLPYTHKELLQRYVTFLQGKRLGDQTVVTYRYFVLRFIDFAKDVEISAWETTMLDRFMEQVLAQERYSISSHRQCVSALKYLTRLCELPDFDAEGYKRPKKSKFLPVVLSKEEVIDLLQVTRNLKHRAILAMIYSGGLRIGELINLRLRDVDMDRNQICIKSSKGRKDRTVMMSKVIRPLLYNYVRTYRPEDYFVEGQHGGKYSASSVRNFLKVSCKRAGIRKRVTPHTLRHSYATHLLENGVDVRLIQELLGHAKPETTMLYTHVARNDLLEVSNPLDVAVSSLTKQEKADKKVLLSRKLW